MKINPGLAALVVSALSVLPAVAADHPLGLPPVPTPPDNPTTPDKVALGERLFEDTRFSSTGEVSCATCHSAALAFTDSPLSVSEGIEGKTGTRNAPTVINAAFSETLFWDGRSPTLEDQALHPFLNPVEMALESHDAILEVIQRDSKYKSAFKKVFGVKAKDISMTEVTQAIAAFERTIVSGDSRFDRWFYGGEAEALSEAEARGYDLFVGQARCVSCHVIEQTQATFTDNQFHNIGVGINAIQADVPQLAGAFLAAERTMEEVDVAVLTDPRTSELGRFAVSREFDGIGAFKTPTLRNIAATAPYMHDGSLATLREVLVHYNNGGVTEADDPVNDFLSGGIRPLGLTEPQLDDLEAFMHTLTSPAYAEQATAPN